MEDKGITEWYKLYGELVEFIGDLVKRFLKEQEQYSYGIAKACSLKENGLKC